MSDRFVQVVVVNDYHDIEYVASSFPALKLHSLEIGTTMVRGTLKYAGVVFEGRKPSQDTIKALINQAGIVLKK